MVATNAGSIGSFGQERVERIANEVARRAQAAKDYVAPRGKLSVTATDTGLALVVQNGTEKTYPLNRSALVQLAGVLRFPVDFLDRLEAKNSSDLVAATMSEQLQRDDPTRQHLVRVLDDRARALLSDKFDRSIQNDDVMSVVLEEADKLGAVVWDFALTDTLFRIKLIAPDVLGKVEHAFKGKGAHDWAEFKDDVHNPACDISNSETGHGRFMLSIADWRRACRNYAISEKVLAKTHLGQKLEEGEQAILSEETRTLDMKALHSRVRDGIRTAFDPERFAKFMQALSATTGRGVDKDVKASDVVEVTAKEYGLPQARKDAVLEAWLSKGKTQYSLGQALSAQSNPDNAGDLDDGARTDFERASGAVLALGEKDWKAFTRKILAQAQDAVDATKVVVRK